MAESTLLTPEISSKVKSAMRLGVSNKAILKRLVETGDNELVTAIDSALAENIPVDAIVRRMAVGPQRTAGEQFIQDTGPLQRFADQFTAGVEEVPRGLFQLGSKAGEMMGLVSPETQQLVDQFASEPGRLMNPALEEDPISGILARGLGGSVPLAGLGPVASPAQSVGRLGRLGRLAGGGAIAGASQPVPEGQDFLGTKVLQTGAGGLAGVVVPKAIEKALVPIQKMGLKAGEFLRRVKNREPQSMRIAGELGIDPKEISDELIKVIERDQARLKKISGLSPEQQQRLIEFEQVFKGRAKPTAAQLQQDFELFRRQNALKKLSVGDDLRNQLQEQQNAISEFLEELKSRTGGAGTDEFARGQNVIRNIAGRTEQGQLETGFLRETKSQVQEAFERAEAAPGGEELLDSIRFAQTIEETVEDFGDVIPGPIKTSLDDLTSKKNFTLDRAFRLRRQLNKRIDPTDPSKGEINKALGQIKQALDEEISKVEGASEKARLTKDAIRLAKEEFDIKDIPAVDMIDRAKAVEENFFDKAIRRASTKDVERFVRFLRGESDPKNLKISPEMDAMRQQALKELQTSLLEQAMNASLKEAAEGFTFSGRNFEKFILDKIGSRKMGLIFKGEPEIMRDIFTLIRVGKNLKGPIDADNPSRTAATLIDEMLNFMQKVPGMQLLGLRGRIVENLQGREAAKLADGIGTTAKINRLTNMDSLFRLINALPTAQASGVSGVKGIDRLR